jgi:hypothetical protein
MFWAPERHLRDKFDRFPERRHHPRGKLLAENGRSDVTVVPNGVLEVVARLRENSCRHASEVEVASKALLDLID